MTKKAAPYNFAFLKYFAAAVVLYFAADHLWGDLIRETFVTRRSVNLVQASFIALIIDGLAVALVVVEKLPYSIRPILPKVAADVLVIWAVFYTRTLANPAAEPSAWTVYEYIHFGALGAAFLMFAFSAYMAMTYVRRGG